jgi:hypothetical protein
MSIIPPETEATSHERDWRVLAAIGDALDECTSRALDDDKDRAVTATIVLRHVLAALDGDR